MQVPLGETALLVQLGDAADDAAARRVRALVEALAAARLPGVSDLVAAHTTITVHCTEPSVRPAIERWIERWTDEHARSNDVNAMGEANGAPARELVVPVSYGGRFGEDLAAVADHCGLTPSAVIEAHAAARYVVRAIGFTPGFPYLAGLPPQLAVPRRRTPRLAVAAGSVAIGGAQTGIYSIESPGGWHVIGRTHLALFDPIRTPATLLSLGDGVRFEPIAATTFRRRLRTLPPTPRAAARPRRVSEALFEVVEAGPQTTLQDLGRPGLQAQGITPGGALDTQALRLANRLVGNADATLGLEFGLVGPQLRARRALRLALTGASVAKVPGGRPFEVEAGTLLDLRLVTRGARGYLAVAGGFDVPPVLGGRGTDLRARFGGLDGRALQAGDRLFGPRGAPRLAASPLPAPNWFVDAAHLCGRDLHAPIRLLRGPQADWFAVETWNTLLARAFLVTTHSDRMGVRLAGPLLPLAQPRELLSEGVVAGTVQVPPDGQPIVLLADRQTIGGYPKLATVVAADLGRLAQRRPGDAVRFEVVHLATAHAAAAEEERAMAMLDVALKLHGARR